MDQISFAYATGRYHLGEFSHFLKTLLILGLFLPSCLFAQILKVDSINLSLSGNIPFDQSFVVQIPDPHSSIVAVDVYKIFIRKGQASFFPSKILPPGEKKDEAKFLNTAVFSRKKQHINVFIGPLAPNTYFELRLRRKFRGQALLELRKIAYQIHLGKSQNAELDALLSNLQPILHDLDKTAFGASGGPNSWLNNYYNQFVTYIGSDVSPIFHKLNTNLKHYTPQNLSLGNWQKITVLAKNLKIKTERLGSFWRMNESNKIVPLQKGWVSMTAPYEKETNAFTNFEKKISNLKKSLPELDSLIDLVYQVKINDQLNQTMLDSVLFDLAELRKQMIQNISLLTEAMNDFRTKIDSEGNIRYVNSLTANNEVFNLKTKGSRQIIPEIGLASIFANGNTTSPTITRPFVGASIYFRQTDKNIPLRHLRNSWLHRLSLSIGVTVIPIDTEEFNDLYNKISLLTGVNFKITRAIGINGGWAWLKQNDVNPAVDDLNIAPRPYVGLTVDFDVAEGLSKVTSKFGLK